MFVLKFVLKGARVHSTFTNQMLLTTSYLTCPFERRPGCTPACPSARLPARHLGVCPTLIFTREGGFAFQQEKKKKEREGKPEGREIATETHCSESLPLKPYLAERHREVSVAFCCLSLALSKFSLLSTAFLLRYSR